MGEEDGRKGGRECGRGSECIHAGQFMSTRVHDPDALSSDEDAEIDVVTSDTETDILNRRSDKQTEKPPKPIPAEEKPITFYKFGPKQTRSIAIDVSLGKLNKWINFAYKRLTTPRWKYFHGIKLSWKERLRLNNVIWRSWHMEFVGRQNPKYCCYSVPVEETHHQHPEAAVLEGMYWKRRLDAVCAQYKRWRMNKPPGSSGRGNGRPGRLRRHASGSGMRPRPSLDGADGTSASESKLLESEIAVFVPHPPSSRSSTGPTQPPTIGSSADTDSILGLGGQFFDKDDLDNIFTDRLFDSLNQTSYMFPDPKDLHVGAGAHSKNADFIQPSLITLQPSLDDIMASLGEEDERLFEENAYKWEFPPAPVKGGKGKNINSDEMGLGTSGASMASPPTTTLSSYSSKDLEDAALLLHPHNQYSSAQPSPRSNYSHPETGLPMDPMLQMGPPNAPTITNNHHHYPTPSKGSLKAFPHPPPPIQDHPKVRAKRAKQRAKAQELEQLHHQQQQQQLQQATRSNVVTMQPHIMPTTAGAHGQMDMSRIAMSSAFTPVPQLLPYRPGGPPGPVSPQHYRSQLPPQPGPPSFTGFMPKPSQAAPLTQPVLLVKPTQGLPALPTYPYAPNPLQLSPLPSPSSAASSTQSASPVTSPLNLQQPPQQSIVPNTPIKKEPLDRASPSSVAGAASTSRAAKEESATVRSSRRGNSGKAGTKRAAADSTMDPNERKRMLHLHAEQSRRSALKSGFDQLEELLPNLSPGAKSTNAAILARASEHIRDLRDKVESEQVELRRVEDRVASMNERIRLYQTDMPSGGSGPGGGSSLVGLASAFVRQKTKEDWKFAILWRLCSKLWRSFVTEVEGKTVEELAVTARDWAVKHCTVLELRPEMSSLLIELATERPGVLTNPSALPAAVVALAEKTHP